MIKGQLPDEFAGVIFYAAGDGEIGVNVMFSPDCPPEVVQAALKLHQMMTTVIEMETKAEGMN